MFRFNKMSSIDKFLKKYSKAFLEADTEFLINNYDEPAIFYTENGDVAEMNRDQLKENMSKLCSLYQEIGVTDAIFEVQENIDISKNLSLVSVLWLFNDINQKEIYNATTRYILNKHGRTPKIRSVIVVNENTNFVAAYKKHIKQLKKGRLPAL